MVSLTWIRPVIASLAGALLLVGACRSTPDRLTYDNYSRITQRASTQSEVSALLGEPTNRLDAQWLYERPDQHLIVFVDFDHQGRVTRKQWIDGRSGTWDDMADPSVPGSTHSQTIRRSTITPD